MSRATADRVTPITARAPSHPHGGGLLELRSNGGSKDKPRTRLRVGAFGGLEPRILEAGWVGNVRKAGGYVAVDAPRNRHQVVGFVTVRDSNLTERSVVTTTNFVPVGSRAFLYSWSVSVGRSLGPRVYLSGDYSTSLAVLQLFAGGDVQVENRPRTHRYQGSANVHLTRTTSLLVVAEYLRDNGVNEARVMSGVNYRLKQLVGPLSLSWMVQFLPCRTGPFPATIVGQPGVIA